MIIAWIRRLLHKPDEEEKKVDRTEGFVMIDILRSGY